MFSSINIVHQIQCLLLLNFYIGTHAEFFTAIADMEYLLEIQKHIIDDLDFYVTNEENQLPILERYLNIFKKEHEKAMKDISNYLHNPINAFTLIKRLTSDLDYIEHIVKTGAVHNKNTILYQKYFEYPTEEDLLGAALAIARLQETYNLNTKELADGKLYGVSYGSPMSAGDCYELGRNLLQTADADIVNALTWMDEALRKYNEENVTYPFTDVNIMENISYAYYLLGDLRSAHEWAQKLLDIDTENISVQHSIQLYEKGIAAEAAEEEFTTEPPVETERDRIMAEKSAIYKALCRGDIVVPIEISSRLTCRYLTESHPFLKIAPIKMEMMYTNPDVVLFYDVLHDEEIEIIKQIAKPRLTRAKIFSAKTKRLANTYYRISKSAWISDTESDVVARISRRVSHMTGLNMDSAEEMQVVNYGLAGYYGIHYDFTMRGIKFPMFNDNRIATVMFYMSDVALGGATVFIELGVRVTPVKGAAIFWLNLHPSGEGDFATTHAACPVLHGSKWVCNKWLHETGQELIRPCDLEYQQEGFRYNIPNPVPTTEN